MRTFVHGEPVIGKSALLLLCAVIFSAGLAPSAWASLASGKHAYEKKDYPRALKELSAEAKQGTPEAMFLLGKMYADGQGVPRSDSQAFSWFKKAADANHAGAQGMLGMFYAQGRGAQRDNTKSIEWARRAAENGDPLSQYMMGVRSLDGLGVPKSAEEAITWFGTAAEQNYALAQYALGVLIAFGPAAEGEADKQREFRIEGAKWLMLATRQKSEDVLNGTAKLDELKKRMKPQDIVAAEARVRAWKPMAQGKS